jgi:hypothetical protein
MDSSVMSVIQPHPSPPLPGEGAISGMLRLVAVFTGVLGSQGMLIG